MVLNVHLFFVAVKTIDIDERGETSEKNSENLKEKLPHVKFISVERSK